jgi:hypothetical protein
MTAEEVEFLRALIALRRTLEEKRQPRGEGDPFLAMLVDAVVELDDEEEDEEDND